MKFSSDEVYRVLKNNKIEYLYHANSVKTSCNFLRKGALLSRGSMEAHNLPQTPQRSDEIDKKIGIWPDVFTDSVDIHRQAGRINYYGPVLFMLHVESLKKVDGGFAWVTRFNPTKWTVETPNDRWFNSLNELEEGFIDTEFDQMIVFRDCEGELSIRDSLAQIILDDPQQNIDGNDLFDIAHTALSAAAKEAKINVPIVKRTCSKFCSCISDYGKYVIQTRSMFLP